MQEVPIFARNVGFDWALWQQAMEVWHARTVRLARGKYLFEAGDSVRDIFVVVSGSVHMAVDDYWGNRSVLSEVGPGQLLGAAYAFGAVDTYPICAQAVRDSEVLAFAVRDYRASADTHAALFALSQMAFLQAVSGRSVALIHTIEQVKQRTLRQKILAYLSYLSRLQGSADIQVPLSRQQMADYLAVDRTALSRELSRLRSERVLDYHKNRFVLYLSQPS